eukprot:UN09484
MLKCIQESSICTILLVCGDIKVSLGPYKQVLDVLLDEKLKYPLSGSQR